MHVGEKSPAGSGAEKVSGMWPGRGPGAARKYPGKYPVSGRKYIRIVIDCCFGQSSSPRPAQLFSQEPLDSRFKSAYTHRPTSSSHQQPANMEHPTTHTLSDHNKDYWELASPVPLPGISPQH